MVGCKACGSVLRVKNGFSPDGVQKYRCSDCGSSYREGDNRLKHSLEKRIHVLKMYREGFGIRHIERQEGISSSLILYWIKNFGELLKKEIRRKFIPSYGAKIEIIEVESSIFSPFNLRETPFHGLLWSGEDFKLLLSR